MSGEQQEVTIKTTVADLNIALGTIEQAIGPQLNVLQNWRHQAITQLQAAQQPVTEDEGAAE